MAERAFVTPSEAEGKNLGSDSDFSRSPLTVYALLPCGSRFASHVSRLTALFFSVSCALFPVSCFLFPVSCFSVCCLLSTVFSLFFFSFQQFDKLAPVDVAAGDYQDHVLAADVDLAA